MSFYPRGLVQVAALIVVAAIPPASVPAGELPFLLELPGIATLIHYVPGSLDRAAHVQMRFELLLDAYGQWTKDRHRQNLFVLDREAWEGMESDVPYGIPMRIADGVALAAAGDDGTVELWRGLVGDALPTSATGSGMALQSTASEVGSLALNDLIAEVEVARRLAESSEVRGEAPWLDELIAHVVAQSAFLRHEEGRLPEIDLVFARLQELRQGPVPLVAGATPSEVSLEAWLAYQGRYHDGARAIVLEDGLGAVKRLHKLARKTDSRLTAEALWRRYPGLGEWFQRSFRE